MGTGEEIFDSLVDRYSLGLLQKHKYTGPEFGLSDTDPPHFHAWAKSLCRFSVIQVKAVLNALVVGIWTIFCFSEPKQVQMPAAEALKTAREQLQGSILTVSYNN